MESIFEVELTMKTGLVLECHIPTLPGTPHVSPARVNLVLGRETPKPCAAYTKAHSTTKQSFTNFPAVEIKKKHTLSFKAQTT